MKCKDCGGKIEGRKVYCKSCAYDRYVASRKRYYKKNRVKLLKINKIKEKKYMKNCVDCGKSIYRDSTRCKSCASKIKTKKQRKDQSLMMTGKNNPKWNGGIRKSHKYIQLLMKKHPFCNSEGYIMKHRLIVEKKIGRYLTKKEVVHHIDKNKQNNKISNLMLFPTQKEHAKFHTKLKQFGFTNPILRKIKNRWKNVI